jgi:hypothetical protein
VRRDEALAVLGLPPDADGATVGRRFRALARELHPDRGGDPAAFAELDRAYAVLRAEPAPPRPRVARGRPSRTAPTVATAACGGAADGDAAALAAALLGRRDPATGAGRLRLISVAPGARRNRLAAALPEGTLGVLELRLGGRGTEVRLTVRTRAARRAVTALALDGPDLAAPWSRRRGDAAIELRCTPRTDGTDPAAAAGAAAGAAARLLAALAWPVADWHVEG